MQKQFTSGPLRIAQWASLVNAHIFPGPAIVKSLKSAAQNAPPSFYESVQTEIVAEESRREQEEEDSQIGRSSTRCPPGEIMATKTIQSHSAPSNIARTTSSGAKPDVDTEVAEMTEQIPLEKGLLLLAEMSSEGNLLTGTYTEHCVSLAREHRDFVLGFIAQRSLNTEPDDNFITFTPGVSLPPAQSPKDAEMKGDGQGQQYNSPRRIILEHGSDVVIVGRGILNAKDPAHEAERYRKEAWNAYLERLGTK